MKEHRHIACQTEPTEIEVLPMPLNTITRTEQDVLRKTHRKIRANFKPNDDLKIVDSPGLLGYSDQKGGKLKNLQGLNKSLDIGSGGSLTKKHE